MNIENSKGFTSFQAPLFKHHMHPKQRVLLNIYIVFFSVRNTTADMSYTCEESTWKKRKFYAELLDCICVPPVTCYRLSPYFQCWPVTGVWTWVTAKHFICQQPNVLQTLKHDQSNDQHNCSQSHTNHLNRTKSHSHHEES